MYELKPIESAPKDGTRFIAFDENGDYPEIAYLGRDFSNGRQSGSKRWMNHDGCVRFNPSLWCEIPNLKKNSILKFDIDPSQLKVGGKVRIKRSQMSKVDDGFDLVIKSVCMETFQISGKTMGNYFDSFFCFSDVEKIIN